MKYLYDVTRRQIIRLWITYGSIFVLIFVAGYILSQGVINQPWTARTHMGTTVMNGSIYVVGGQSSTTGELLSDIWEIDPDQASLRAVAQLPFACYRPEIASSGESLFVLGGYDGDAYRAEVVRVENSTAEILSYFPSPRAYGAAVTAGNTLYYAGGWDGQRVLDEILAIDQQTGNLSVIGHLPSPRRFVTAVHASGRIYFIGGEGQSSELLSEIVEFNPVAQRIERIDHLPTSRYLVQAIAFGDDILVFGGKDSRSLHDVIRVDLSDDGIQSSVIAQIPELSWELTVEVIENRIFILGREDSDYKRAIGLLECLPEDAFSLESIRLRKSPWS